LTFTYRGRRIRHVVMAGYSLSNVDATAPCLVPFLSYSRVWVKYVEVAVWPVSPYQMEAYQMEGMSGDRTHK